MSVSNDAGHFFQTTEALATTERKQAKAKNKHGNPIKLPSKILAVHEKDDHSVYIAEAAGEIKIVDLETNTIKKLSTPASAPLTSIAISPLTKTLYAGCWDKHIYTTPLSASNQDNNAPRRLTGHTDFVKCLLATSLSGHPILLSGSADATIIVWDLSTGKLLHKLKGHTKAVQDLAIDPFSLPADSASPGDEFVLFSASSDREIRRWRISLAVSQELAESVENPILAHETSVYRLRFDGDGDLWTASADKTARHLVREREWAADTVLTHSDFVRDVLPCEEAGVVVTACRDEGVRVWDLGSGELSCLYDGHWEEVTGLAAVGRAGCVSVSIDGTVRRWGVDKKAMGEYKAEIEKEKSGADVEGEQEVKKEGMLTAEEEAELAELMDSDDE